VREIKFRGRLNPDRISTNPPRWVYGYFFIRRVSGSPVIIDNEGTFWLINPETVGQYTGLKDKNGKEVYADDLIRNDSGRIGKVVWFIWCWDVKVVKCLPGDNAIGFNPPAWSRHVELIGNAHDNPELSEGK